MPFTPVSLTRDFTLVDDSVTIVVTDQEPNTRTNVTITSSSTPADGSVTDATVAPAAEISLDKTVDSPGSPGRLAMTGAQAAKLDDIEAGATANAPDELLRDRSTHAGTQAQSTVTGLENRLDAMDGISDIGNTGSGLALTPGSGNGCAKLLNLTAPEVAIGFNAPASPSQVASMELVLTQDGTGGRLVSWPASVRWPGGEAPALSAAPGAVDRVVFTTYDGGTTWYGDLVGQAYA